MADKERLIHFGYFVRSLREAKGWSREKLGAKIGRGDRQIWNIEERATPPRRRTTIEGIAQAFDMGPDDLDAAWRKTPVPKPDPQTEGPRQRQKLYLSYAEKDRDAAISIIVHLTDIHRVTVEELIDTISKARGDLAARNRPGIKHPQPERRAAKKQRRAPQ